MNLNMIEHNHIIKDIRFIKSQPKLLVNMTKNTVSKSVHNYLKFLTFLKEVFSISNREVYKEL